ncbi:uncharacterized PE-PGRS family protein PE_PGRS24-like isoform X2 [Leguminivora glycinivorella]|uniref:uncharacterized PE-PGRS family protein PE_PGRS24-like isoform X2 n=1 Tax=Leguminivora glycinivorella TaxID=1035111 RepID=UPI00200E43AF|nr:uncharacterized PE-PGRS family protein PE_PGRS24-like isoform X2 [Leguminivora glycinivorella]
MDNMTVTDSGTYTCRAGELNDTITIIVNGTTAGAQPGVGGPGAWNNGPLGGQPGVGSPGAWTNGPFGGQPGGVGSPTALNNGLVGGSSLYGQGPPGPPGGWNHGPIGGSGSFGPGGWYKGPIGGGGSLFGPGTPGRWHNEQTFNNQDSSKKADSDTLTVGTSGSSSPQEVHFALSLVPLLRAQPLAEKLQKEADILRTFNPNHVFPGFHQPIVYPGAYTPAQAY